MKEVDNMISDNYRCIEFLGLIPWYEQGIDGTYGLSITGENINRANPSAHALNTLSVFKQIAPGRKVIYVGNEDSKYAKNIDLLLESAKKLNADTMFMSFVTDSGGYERLAELDYFTPFCAIGNEGDDEYNPMAIPNNIISVGAYYLRESGPAPAHFSSKSEHLDFCAPTLLATEYTDKFSGTSCSTPVLAGMAALVNDFFIQKTGKPLTREKMVQFMKDNSHDIGAEGFDIKTGHGMVILPDPRTIDIAKYAEKEEVSIDMGIRQCILTENDCFKAGRTIKPQGIMMHSTGADNPYLKRYIQPNDGFIGDNSYQNHWNRDVGLGVHAFIGKCADGSIATYQTLPWDHRAWHCGDSANNTHIAFEICEDNKEDATYFEAMYAQAVALTAHLCELYELDPMEDGVVICHSEGHARGIASNHEDVMHWFPKHGKDMDTFRKDVESMMMEKTVYKTFEEIPQWGKATVEKLIEKKALTGTTSDTRASLNMSHDMLRILVINDRVGLYGE